MIAEVGIFSLILSLIFSLYGSVSYIFSNLNKRFQLEISDQVKISNLIFLFTLLSFACLIYSFLISDFSLNVIKNNSNSQLPLKYKFTGVWGNHEGSILLWLLVMTFFCFLFSKVKTINLNLKKNILSIQIILCFFVCLFVVMTSNPFEKTFPPAIEGADLNPLLQDPGLIIHPPFLYLGYVGFSIVYSIAVGVLLTKEKSLEFVKVIKPWIFISWTFLTFGIGLGSWWAYYELGWGGFWFWDPVENASLLPWLTASALLHTIVMTEKNHTFLNWTLLLSIITFSLSLLGTFLVRSGVLISVHAFANDPTRGIFIIILLAIVFGFGIGMFLKNYKKFSLTDEIMLLSREGAISLNNIFLLSISFTILVGTIFPLFAGVLFDSKISVGAPFFNSILSPIIVPLMLGMILGPYLNWRKDDFYKILERLKLLLLLLLFLGILVWYLNHKGPVIAIVFFILSLWVIASSIFELYNHVFQNIKKKKRKIFNIPIKILSQTFAHMGIAFLIFGATGSSVLKEEKIQFQVKGEIIEINNYKIKFLDVVDVEGPNYISKTGNFEIYKGKKFLNILKPEKRFYYAGKQTTTEAAIHSTLLGDLYIAIGDKNSSSKIEAWTTRIWYNPFTVWIWIGVLFLVFGGIFSMIKSLKTRK